MEVDSQEENDFIVGQIQSRSGKLFYHSNYDILSFFFSVLGRL